MGDSTITFRVPADLIEGIDRVCEEEGIKRSELIRAAVVAFVEGPASDAPQRPTTCPECARTFSIFELIQMGYTGSADSAAEDPPASAVEEFDAAVHETVNQVLPDAPASEIEDGGDS